MKEIVVISGKGGTGKTSITASFAYLGGKDVVVADCDVDAADMHLLMQPDFAKSEDFFSGEIAVIDQDKCTKCGKCADVCRFNAIPVINDQYVVQPLDCEGCGYCSRVCIGADNSGKLVAKVKNEAKQIAKENNKNYIIIDGSPGIGCPVISSLSGAGFVVLVTEPTVAGLHDLKRVYKLVKQFNIETGCIINKSDLNLKVSNEIEGFLKEEDIIHISSLPYDETFTTAMTLGQTIVEYGESNLKEIIKESWEKVIQIVGKKSKK
jgi:MinD superfamily P-loop ATPase